MGGRLSRLAHPLLNSRGSDSDADLDVQPPVPGHPASSAPSPVSRRFVGDPNLGPFAFPDTETTQPPPPPPPSSDFLFAAIRSSSLVVAHKESESIARIAQSAASSSASRRLSQLSLVNTASGVSPRLLPVSGTPLSAGIVLSPVSVSAKNKSRPASTHSASSVASAASANNTAAVPREKRPSLEEILHIHSFSALASASPASTSIPGTSQPNPTPLAPLQQQKLASPFGHTSLLSRRLGNRSAHNLSITHNQHGQQLLHQQQPQQHLTEPFFQLRSISNPSPSNHFQSGPSSPLTVIAPQRLDLSNILPPKNPIDSPMTSRIGANNSLSISTKPGSTLPHLITTLLDPRTLPAWLAPLASLTPFESVKRTDFAFRVIEECESYRQSPASASTPYTGPAAAAVAHLLGALPATAAAAQTRAGMMRNRYTDIYPYDLWRVVLHHASPLVSRSRGGGGAFGGPASPSVPVLGTDGVPLLSEYINASILDTRYVGVRAGDAAFEERFDAGVGVEGCLRAGVGVRGRRYISTQGPMAETVGDFWCMLWDQRSSVVVMLTREEEKGRVKCFRYWPEEGPEYAQVWPHGVSGYEIRVECVEGRGIGEVGEIFVRRFEVSRAPVDAGEVDEVRIIHQVHFTGWPDHKSADPSSVLKVIDVTNTLQREAGPEAGPMTVHCSAGCGRTGTFCVIDTLLYQLTTAIPHLRKRSSADDLVTSPISSSSTVGATASTKTRDENDRAKKRADASGVVSPSLQQPARGGGAQYPLQEDPVFQCVMTLRSQRVTMVQTLDQYAFCYEAIVARIAELQARAAGGEVSWEVGEASGAGSPMAVEEAPVTARSTGGWKVKRGDEKADVGAYPMLATAAVPPTPGGPLGGGGGSGGAFDWDAAMANSDARRK